LSHWQARALTRTLCDDSEHERENGFPIIPAREGSSAGCKTSSASPEPTAVASMSRMACQCFAFGIMIKLSTLPHLVLELSGICHSAREPHAEKIHMTKLKVVARHLHMYVARVNIAACHSNCNGSYEHLVRGVYIATNHCQRAFELNIGDSYWLIIQNPQLPHCAGILNPVTPCSEPSLVEIMMIENC